MKEVIRSYSNAVSEAEAQERMPRVRLFTTVQDCLVRFIQRRGMP